MWLLNLPRPICIDVEGGLPKSKQTIRYVHLSGVEDSMLTVLDASIGQDVAIEGEVLAVWSGHHHEPLVVMVRTLTPSLPKS